MKNNPLFRLSQNNSFQRTVYAVLSDAIVLTIIGFAGLMTLEGILPGFVSTHLSLTKVSFVLAIFFIAHNALSRIPAVSSALQKNPYPLLPRSRTILIFLVFWSFLLTINALLKFPLPVIVITVILTGMIGKFFYDEILTK